MSVSDTFIHDNDSDSFGFSMPLMLYARSLERLSEQKNVSPFLDQQGVLLIKKKTPHSIDNPLVQLSVEDYRVYAVEFPAQITVNQQKYMVYSKPLGVLPHRNFLNLEEYVVSQQATPLEQCIWNVLKSVDDIGLSAQTFLKAVIAHTDETFQSLLDDAHCAFSEFRIPQNGTELKRAVNVALQLPLQKKHFQSIAQLSPEWAYFVDHWKEIVKADNDALNIIVQDAIVMSQNTSSFSM